MAAAAAPVSEDLARALDATAEALRRAATRRSPPWALEIARAVDDDLAVFFDAVAAARVCALAARPAAA